MNHGPLTGPSHSQVACRQHQPLSGRKDSHTLAHTLSRCTHWDAQMLLQSRWVWWLHMGGSQSQKLHMWKSGSWTQKSTSYQVVVIMVPCSQRVILVMQDLSCLMASAAGSDAMLFAPWQLKMRICCNTWVMWTDTTQYVMSILRSLVKWQGG